MIHITWQEYDVRVRHITWQEYLRCNVAWHAVTCRDKIHRDNNQWKNFRGWWFRIDQFFVLKPNGVRELLHNASHVQGASLFYVQLLLLVISLLFFLWWTLLTQYLIHSFRNLSSHQTIIILTINLNKKRNQNCLFFCELYTHSIKLHSELTLQVCRFF